MAYDGRPPKYVQLLEAVKRRISDGTYRLGSKLPSETEFIREFDISRQVVIRAMLVLEQDGWIRGEQGRGRVVLGMPDRGGAWHGADRLHQAETIIEAVSVKVLSAGPVKAPNRAAYGLQVKAGTPVMARQRLLISVELGPVELSTTYLPLDLAADTDIGADTPLPEGVVEHLRTRKRVVLDHAEEQISARLPTADEAGLLELGPRDAVLTLLVTGYDRDDAPCLVLDALIPTTRQVLTDAYPLG